MGINDIPKYEPESNGNNIFSLSQTLGQGPMEALNVGIDKFWKLKGGLIGKSAQQPSGNIFLERNAHGYLTLNPFTGPANINHMTTRFKLSVLYEDQERGLKL